ncbi:hypothetical protein GMST_23090 [Geomonas silvestris]|uniref:histidine kinase n=1 Tax=Geomonas silvestris TaxID=2740184 RepID=A0A6V8MJ60_9BACT|nr:ATP-binding protein [Geomonas silvestris]GFO59984.1 hypothetical protein GMST_23090 [Geomonas silvestris]
MLEANQSDSCAAVAELYRLFFSQMQEPALILRLTPGEKEPRVVPLDMNDAAKHLTGRVTAALDETARGSLLPQSLEVPILEHAGAVLETGRPAAFLLQSASLWHQVRIQALGDGVIGVLLSDATAQKRTEETLATLRTLSAALHATADLELIMDKVAWETLKLLSAENSLIALCSPDGFSSYRFLRLGTVAPADAAWQPGQELPGRVVFSPVPYLSSDALHDPHIDPGLAARHRVRNVISTPLWAGDGSMIGYLELQNRLDGGVFSEFDLEQLSSVAQMAAQAVKNAQDFQKIAQNASQLEERVAERTAQLQEVNEELDAFAFSVSHGLRAPLRAIVSFAGILQDQGEGGGDPERDAFLARIIAVGQDMDQLIQDLLAYSRLSSDEIALQTVQLAAVLQEAVLQLRHAGQTGDIVLEGAQSWPSVRGNFTVLVQVVWNLLSNALKYVASGCYPKVRVWTEPAQDVVRLWVQDNGIGIAPENQERIFQVFERLHGVESYPGTGIGLAIARKAVQRLGGRIGVISCPGEGSRFWIDLPATPDR